MIGCRLNKPRLAVLRYKSVVVAPRFVSLTVPGTSLSILFLYVYTYIYIYIYMSLILLNSRSNPLLLKKMKKRLSIVHCYIADSSTEEKPINGLRIRCHRKLIDRDNVQRVQLFLNWIWRHLLDLLIHFQSCLFYERIRYEGGSGTRHNSCRSIPGCWKTLLGRRN